MPFEESNEIKVVEKKKKWIIPAIIGMVVLIAGSVVAGLLFYNSDAKSRKELQKQLDLGEKYLADMDYEKAILSYKAAIVIEPKCVDAYLALGYIYGDLANQCLEDGDKEGALKYLEKGIEELNSGKENTNSDEIANLIDEMEEKKVIESQANEEKRDDKEKDEGDKKEKEVEDFQEEVDYDAIYEPVLKENLDFINKYAGKDVYGEDLSNYQYVSGGIAMEIAWSDKESWLNRIGYVIMDINGDGISELLLGEKEESRTLIWTGYTYKDGKIVAFLNGGYRHECYWIGNGEFMCTSNGSAWDCTFEHNFLNKGASELTCDNFYFATTFNYDDTVYYRNNTTYSTDIDTAESITKDEFEQFYNGFNYEILNMKPLKS